MINKLLTLTLFQILFFAPGFGQDKLFGTLTNESNTPIEFSTISLMKNGDSIPFKLTITDEKGYFEFSEIDEGVFYINIKEIGFLNYNSKLIYKKIDNIDLGQIQLSPIVNEMKEVSISAKKPLLTVTAEKTVLNVANITNLTGLNALEILRRTPGVMIDKDNNISLKGKTDVRIFLDSRPSQMSNEDLVNMLKGMIATDIEAIEIITNPSSKYDASGTGGIINIVLKKNKGFGNNANIELGTTYSLTAKMNGAISFNHRDKRFNVFGNYSVTGGQWQDYMNLYRNQNGYIFDQKTITKNFSYNNNFKIGTDYFINKKNVLGANFTGNIRTGNWKTNSRANIIIDSTQQIDQILVASNQAPFETYNFNGNVNYRYSDTLGTKFSTDFDLGHFSKSQNTYQPNYYMNADETTVNSLKIYRNNTPTNIQITTLKSDLEKKVKGALISIGYKLSDVETRNTFDFFHVINDQSFKDSNRSNTFQYSEKVYASYLNFNHKIKKISIQAGIRYEYTHSIGTLTSEKSNPEPVNRKYGNLFPSTALTYSINSKNTMTLTYSKRIDRPNYQDLNPFENKIDELTYQKGNAFLKPQYSHSIELAHIYMDFLTTSIGYTKTLDYMTEIIDTLNGNGSYITQTNLNSVDNYNFNLSVPIPIRKWWFGFLNFSLYHNQYNANFKDGKTINLGNTAYNIYLSNSFTLTKGWSIELSGWYNSPSVMVATFLGQQMYSVDAGLKKKILNGNGDLKVNFSDIFHGQVWGGTSHYAGFTMNATGGYESRQIRLNFSYRIGNSSVKSELHKSGAEDEKSRIKTK